MLFPHVMWMENTSIKKYQSHKVDRTHRRGKPKVLIELMEKVDPKY